jgi:hypothetical protein
MVRTEQGRGARRLHIPDWPYGSVGRRLVLEALLLDSQPNAGWTKTALESRAGTRPGGIDLVLAGAVAWQLVERRDDGHWHRVEPFPKIAGVLENVLKLTRMARDEAIPPLPRRDYDRGG